MALKTKEVAASLTNTKKDVGVQNLKELDRIATALEGILPDMRHMSLRLTFTADQEDVDAHTVKKELGHIATVFEEILLDIDAPSGAG